MDLAGLAAELEEDLLWRQDELRLLSNQLVNLSENDKARYRKALIVMLYAHYEGFCKFALSLYANAINNENLTCGQVNHHISAASLSNLFHGLVSAELPVGFLPPVVSTDAAIRRLARQVDLLQALHTLAAQPVAIPIDKVVDTESNLSPVVLQKIVYRLGFDWTVLTSREQELEANINKLLNLRNHIAHGFRQSGLNEDLYEKIQRTTYGIMTQIRTFVWDGLELSQYLLNTGAP